MLQTHGCIILIINEISHFLTSTCRNMVTLMQPHMFFNVALCFLQCQVSQESNLIQLLSIIKPINLMIELFWFNPHMADSASDDMQAALVSCKHLPIPYDVNSALVSHFVVLVVFWCETEAIFLKVFSTMSKSYKIYIYHLCCCLKSDI